MKTASSIPPHPGPLPPVDTRLKVVSIFAGGEGTLAGDLRAVFRFQSFQLWSLCLAGIEQERLKSSMQKQSICYLWRSPASACLLLGTLEFQPNSNRSATLLPGALPSPILADRQKWSNSFAVRQFVDHEEDKWQPTRRISRVSIPRHLNPARGVFPSHLKSMRMALCLTNRRRRWTNRTPRRL